MRFGPARTRAVHRYGVSVPIEDGPVMDAPAYGGAARPRFRPDSLRINYDEGELTSVEVSGVKINADGSEHRLRSPATIDYVGRDGQLHEDTPEWVRQAVRDHPWPADPWPAAVASSGA